MAGTNDTNSTRLCLDCGADLSGRHGNTRRCSPCQSLHAKRLQQEKHLRRWTDPDFKSRENARRRKRRAERRDDDEYVEYERKRGREWKGAKRAKDPEYREKQKHRCREWYHRRMSDPKVREAVNKKLRAYARAWERAKRKDPKYREAMNKKRRERYAQDAEYRARVNLYSRARKKWDKTVTVKTVEAVLRRQKRKCACCGKSIAKGFHMDHILPQSRGGASTLRNLQLLCGTCNMSKRANLAYYPPDGGQGTLALGFTE